MSQPEANQPSDTPSRESVKGTIDLLARGVGEASRQIESGAREGIQTVVWIVSLATGLLALLLSQPTAATALGPNRARLATWLLSCIVCGVIQRILQRVWMETKRASLLMAEMELGRCGLLPIDEVGVALSRCGDAIGGKGTVTPSELPKTDRPLIDQMILTHRSAERWGVATFFAFAGLMTSFVAAVFMIARAVA